MRIAVRHHAEAHAALLEAHARVERSLVRGDVEDTPDLVAALEELLWVATTDDEGAIVQLKLAFDVKDTWMRTWERVFDALAPYVEPGSYLEMVDEGYGEGFTRRWDFDGEQRR